MMNNVIQFNRINKEKLIDSHSEQLIELLKEKLSIAKELIKNELAS